MYTPFQTTDFPEKVRFFPIVIVVFLSVLIDRPSLAHS